MYYLLTDCGIDCGIDCGTDCNSSLCISWAARSLLSKYHHHEQGIKLLGLPVGVGWVNRSADGRSSKCAGLMYIGQQGFSVGWWQQYWVCCEFSFAVGA
jgi:hypothetical protein